MCTQGTRRWGTRRAARAAACTRAAPAPPASRGTTREYTTRHDTTLHDTATLSRQVAESIFLMLNWLQVYTHKFNVKSKSSSINGSNVYQPKVTIITVTDKINDFVYKRVYIFKWLLFDICDATSTDITRQKQCTSK